MINRKAVGRLVKARRLALGADQADLAAAAGVTRPAITAIENGTQGMRLETAVALAKELGVLLDDLVRGVAVGDSPCVREVIESPDELRLLALWRSLSHLEKLATIKRMMPDTGLRKTAK